MTEGNYDPIVLVERDGFRLIRRVRSQQAWPGLSDVTLEARDKNAMDEAIWVPVTSWCLGPLDRDAYNKIRSSHEAATDLALHLLVNPEFPIIKGSR